MLSPFDVLVLKDRYDDPLDSPKSTLYSVLAADEDNAMLLAFALDGGFGTGEHATGADEPMEMGHLELAKMYCHVER